MYEKYKFWRWRDLTEEQKKADKNSCFVIKYLQLCKEPAYRIKKINWLGEIYFGGIGSYLGYFESKEDIRCVGNPYPKEKLFIYEK